MLTAKRPDGAETYTSRCNFRLNIVCGILVAVALTLCLSVASITVSVVHISQSEGRTTMMLNTTFLSEFFSLRIPSSDSVLLCSTVWWLIITTTCYKHMVPNLSSVPYMSPRIHWDSVKLHCGECCWHTVLEFSIFFQNYEVWIELWKGTIHLIPTWEQLCNNRYYKSQHCPLPIGY